MEPEVDVGEPGSAPEPGAWLLAQSQRLARLGSWEWDLTAGRFTWSEGMFPLYGLPTASPPPTPTAFLDLVHPDDRAGYRAEVRRSLAAGGISMCEHRIVTPDGQVRHIVGWAEVQLDSDGRAVRVVGSAQDQTVRVERDRAVAHSEQLHRLIVDSSPIGIALLDVDGWWVQVNAALCALTGRSAADLLGRHFSEICHPDDDLLPDPALRAELVAGTRSSYRVERRIVRPHGDLTWVDAHISLLHPPEDAGRPQLLAQVLDTTERHRVAAELARQARTDPLTGIANRRAWQHDVQQHLAVARTGAVLAAAILDLDHFKDFNDTHGHGDGDQLLIDATAAWSALLHRVYPDAVLARLGGEEFGVLLPGLDERRAFEVVAALLTLVPRGQTASAGVTLSLPDDDLRTLMTRADAALYTAKRRGRRRVEVRLGRVAAR